MRRVYYNAVRNLSRTLSFFAACVTACLCAAAPEGHQQTSLKAAALETHEGLTISVRPWTDATLYKDKFPKKSPFAAGVIAIQVTFRNDSDESLKVGLERIRLAVQIDPDNRQELQALTAGQVADEILKPGGKDPSKSRAKIPLPVSIPKSSNDKKWKEIEQQAELAGVPASVLAPHSTMQGLLYFDLQAQFDLLNGSRLYIPDIVAMEKNKSLTYFEIDLSGSAGR